LVLVGGDEEDSCAATLGFEVHQPLKGQSKPAKCLGGVWIPLTSQQHHIIFLGMVDAKGDTNPSR
jgi:hypothetical protein